MAGRTSMCWVILQIQSLFSNFFSRTVLWKGGHCSFIQEQKVVTLCLFSCLFLDVALGVCHCSHQHTHIFCRGIHPLISADFLADVCVIATCRERRNSSSRRTLCWKSIPEICSCYFPDDVAGPSITISDILKLFFQGKRVCGILWLADRTQYVLEIAWIQTLFSNFFGRVVMWQAGCCLIILE